MTLPAMAGATAAIETFRELVRSALPQPAAGTPRFKQRRRTGAVPREARADEHRSRESNQGLLWWAPLRMSPAIDQSQIDHFYVAAMLGLRALEARSAAPRRFGPDADARWNAFRGGLQDWHRIELLVRDAAVRNPAGFAPKVVFDLPALADDEPSGPDWPGLPPAEAAALLRTAQSGAKDPLLPRSVNEGLRASCGPAR